MPVPAGRARAGQGYEIMQFKGLNMDGLDVLMNELQDRLIGTREPRDLAESPILYEHELLQAAFALLSKRTGLKPFKPQVSPLESGAVPLFRKNFFPWGGLPYPKEHAELGYLLSHLGDEEMNNIVLRMAHFQEATLDHNKKPILSLFHQEGRGPLHSLEKANELFFDVVCPSPAETLHFTDHELGMVVRRNASSTLLTLGSGCKSGMGAFLHHDAGIINYGPQFLPLGDCSGFGLAGSAQKPQINDEGEWFSFSYLCRLAAPSPRRSTVSDLQDSGYSGLWMEAAVGGSLEGISIHTCFEGMAPLNKIVFSFFGKGEVCSVSGTHLLKPRSLDRYQGPADSLFFLGKKGGVRLDPLEGSTHLEVIPLAGDESFWGADFLASYTLHSPKVAFGLCLR